MPPQIIIGTSSFRKIRENNFYYVDKTSFLVDFLQDGPNEVTLLTRPRRFGKTLTMDMLKEFLDVRNDPSPCGAVPNDETPSLFDGLEIMKHPDVCAKWMHQCPVIFLSLKNMCRDSYSKAVSRYSIIARELSSRNAFLRESSKVKEADKRILAILEDTKDEEILADSLRLLCRAS